LNFRNYVILADIHGTPRGIVMRVGVLYFPTDYGINIAELARVLGLSDLSRDEILQLLDRDSPLAVV